MTLVSELAEALRKAKEHLEYCNYGDAWERSTALGDDGAYGQGGLPKIIDDALARAAAEQDDAGAGASWPKSLRGELEPIDDEPAEQDEPKEDTQMWQDFYAPKDNPIPPKPAVQDAGEPLALAGNGKAAEEATDPDGKWIPAKPRQDAGEQGGEWRVAWPNIMTPQGDEVALNDRDDVAAVVEHLNIVERYLDSALEQRQDAGRVHELEHEIFELRTQVAVLTAKAEWADRIAEACKQITVANPGSLLALEEWLMDYDALSEGKG